MDEDILRRINHLVDEEHHLQRHTQGDEASDDDHRRLRDLEVQLDQCWDLLRQRRARRSSGQQPDGAEVRSAGVVEGYQQ
ncbi:DUF2630 family protein [Pseudonocardia eucalypti]|uniref:DUF2630 family protein n=1 Tax=Pseudonocardia eucalypti TaxID=648755 RepID=A0ABP9RED6_9PSEU|nr:hypothetical protein [Pseudonocardia eucalypti]